VKYAQPAKSTPGEILNALNRVDIAPSDRINAVLSAVYYGDTVEFSGDVLIKEFSECNYKEKIYLKNIFEFFYEVWRTIYRIEESISLLEEYKRVHPEHCLEIQGTIDNIIAHKTISGES
jgi:hypothetical protein